MTNSPARQKLINRTAAQGTEVLMAALKVMDETPRAEKTPEHRLAAAVMCDVLIERLELDAQIDHIFDNLPLEEHLTFYQAIVRAKAL